METVTVATAESGKQVQGFLPDGTFIIPAPYRAWCHQCQGEESTPGIRGKGLMSLEESHQHSIDVHGAWK